MTEEESFFDSESSWVAETDKMEIFEKYNQIVPTVITNRHQKNEKTRQR